MKDLILKKCRKCNALVNVIEDCNCENCSIICCGEQMQIVKANTTDGSYEKHIPTYERIGENIKITVNHVMEEEHYIEWILLKTEKEERKVIFTPNDEPVMITPYEKGANIYSYCNKHGLWKIEIK